MKSHISWQSVFYCAVCVFVCVHLYLSFYLCCDRIRVGTVCFCQVPGKVFIFLLQETLSHLCRYHVSELYCLAHFHFLNFPLLYTIYVPIVYSSSHISPTHKQGQNGSINWISIRHGAVATCNRSIWVYLSVLSGMHSLPLCHLTTDPLNISPAPYSHFISIHLHSRLIRLSVKPLRPLSWNQTNPCPWQ